MRKFRESLTVTPGGGCVLRLSRRLTWNRLAAGEAEAALVPPAAVVQCDGPFRHEHRWRGAGLAVPVFALRTRRSVGVGEFADIKQLADFGHAAGVFADRFWSRLMSS